MGQALSFCKECVCPTDCDFCPELHNWIMESLEEKAALQAYRDTGLSPEEVLDMVENIESRCLVWFDKNYGIGAGRMMELAEADKACQLVVLPCKIGDIVYFVLPDANEYFGYFVSEPHRITEVGSRGFWTSGIPDDKPDNMDDFTPWEELGKTAFLTKQAADAALGGDDDE